MSDAPLPEPSLPQPASAVDVPAEDPHARWRFLRDVAVFEFKLALNNLHNFFQIPLTLGVALVDFIFKGKSEGERFYKIVEVGRTIDDSIDIYSIVSHRERSLNRDYTVDAVLAKLEGVIVREYQKGGTAASVKGAVDRAIDEMQAKAGAGKDRAGDAIRAAADKLREKLDK